MSSLKLFFLGPPRLEREDQLLEVDTRKAVAMLAYLALTGERQSRDRLAAFLWPEFDDRRAKAALRRTLSALKAAVGEDCLFISREVIGLEAEACWCDAIQFEAHIASGEWSDAVALYRGSFLAGFSLRDSIPFDDWQLTQAETYRREISQALESLCRQQHTGGSYPEAINTAHTWLQYDPLREDAHRQLMQLYALSGQRAKALNQFRDCVRILDEELGVAPLPETVTLYEMIRENQYFESDSQNTSQQGLAPVDTPPPPPSALQPNVPTAVPLIGRSQALSQMQRLFGQIHEDGRLLTIEGEVGIGKTRLAETFLIDLQQQGAVVLSARCYEGETNLAYAPIIQILRHGLQRADAAENLHDVPDHYLAEVSWLLPELEKWQATPQPPLSRETPGAKNRFFEGIGQVLSALFSGTQAGVLWLDDVHWLDSASLEILLFLLRRWRQRPYLILLCWRQDALAADHSLPRLAAELRRDGVSDQIGLSRFSAAEVTQLLTAVMPEHSAELPLKLYEETEGLPYFIVEYLNALIQKHIPAALDESWDIPRTVRDLLLSRLAQVDEAERQLLQTAAAIGHDFDYELLRIVSGRSDEEIVFALEKLVARGLFVEQSVPATGTVQAVYDFSHSKLQELAYAEIGLARRRLLHRRVAEALSQPERRQIQTTAVIAEIADHYRQAGLDAEAAAYFVMAGDQARTLFAQQEAIHYYQSALALGFAETWKLHEASADMYTRLGAYASALASYETAASQAETTDLGRLEHKIAQVYIRQGFWQKAEGQLTVAQEQIQQPAELVRLYIDWSYVAFNMKEIKQAKAYAERGQQLAHTAQAQAQCHNISGILARHDGAFAEAMTHFEQSMVLAQANNLPDTEIASLNNLALAEMAVGRYAEAQRHLAAALTLCGRYGDRHREAALHNNLADLHHQMGDEQTSMAELKTAVAIYAEIGGQPGNWQPEIWKLTEW